MHDLADACAFLLQSDNPRDLVNVGFVTNIAIREPVEETWTKPGEF